GEVVAGAGTRRQEAAHDLGDAVTGFRTVGDPCTAGCGVARAVFDVSDRGGGRDRGAADQSERSAYRQDQHRHSGSSGPHALHHRPPSPSPSPFAPMSSSSSGAPGSSSSPGAFVSSPGTLVSWPGASVSSPASGTSVPSP